MKKLSLCFMSFNVMIIMFMASAFALADVVSTAEAVEPVGTVVVGWLAAKLLAAHPAVPIVGLIAYPVVSWVSTRTKNPVGNYALIWVNKLLQAVTFTSGKNQPGVPSLKQLLTMKPKELKQQLEKDVDDAYSKFYQSVANKYKRRR